MNNIPRGQTSTILLSCLVDGDKYGSELLADLEQKTDNQISIKQPTLYSTLSRMEKQGYISSYWRDSKIGGKRHYYRLTDLGKKYLDDSENIIISNFEKNTQNTPQKYDEISHFEKKDDQLIVNTKSSRITSVENEKKQEDDDGVFLETSNVYIIPDLKKPDNKSSKNLQKYDEISDFQEKDEGVFITESLPPEHFPKAKKLDELNFDIPSEAPVVQKIKSSEPSITYQDKIDALYDKIQRGEACKEKINANNQALNSTEDLQERYDSMHIKFYANTVNNAELINSYGKIPTIKLFAKYFTIFMFSLLTSLVIYLFFGRSNLETFYILPIILVPIVLLLPALYYLFTPNKFRRIHKINATLWLSIGIFFVGVIVCYSLNLVFTDINFASITNHPVTFLYPSILLFGFVIGGVFDVVYCKKYCK